MNRGARSSKTKIENAHAALKGLPLTARLWARTLIALTVTVGIGLAPLLGGVGVPLFSPLLSLMPVEVQKQAITLSTAAMSLIAIVVQWSGTSRLQLKVLSRRFKLTLISAILSFVLLFAVDNLFVVRVPYLGGAKSASFLKGIRRPQPDVCVGLSDVSCIKQRLSFDAGRIAGYWGDEQISIARSVYLLSYIALLSHFALLVGLIVLRESRKARK